VSTKLIDFSPYNAYYILLIVGYKMMEALCNQRKWGWKDYWNKICWHSSKLANAWFSQKISICKGL